MKYLISFGLTLLFELLFALLWKVQRRDLTQILLANLLTNPLVVLIHGLLSGHSPMLHTVLPELWAIITEGWIYRRLDNAIHRPALFAIAANLTSYTFGTLLCRLITQ